MHNPALRKNALQHNLQRSLAARHELLARDDQLRIFGKTVAAVVSACRKTELFRSETAPDLGPAS